MTLGFSISDIISAIDENMDEIHNVGVQQEGTKEKANEALASIVCEAERTGKIEIKDDLSRFVYLIVSNKNRKDFHKFIECVAILLFDKKSGDLELVEKRKLTSLLNYVKERVRNEDDRNDIIQDSIEKSLKAKNKKRLIDNYIKYFFKILDNTINNYYSKRKNNSQSIEFSEKISNEIKGFSQSFFTLTDLLEEDLLNKRLKNKKVKKIYLELIEIIVVKKLNTVAEITDYLNRNSCKNKPVKKKTVQKRLERLRKLVDELYPGKRNKNILLIKNHDFEGVLGLKDVLASDVTLPKQLIGNINDVLIRPDLFPYLAGHKRSDASNDHFFKLAYSFMMVVNSYEWAAFEIRKKNEKELEKLLNGFKILVNEVSVFAEIKEFLTPFYSSSLLNFLFEGNIDKVWDFEFSMNDFSLFKVQSTLCLSLLSTVIPDKPIYRRFSGSEHKPPRNRETLDRMNQLLERVFTFFHDSFCVHFDMVLKISPGWVTFCAHLYWNSEIMQKYGEEHRDRFALLIEVFRLEKTKLQLI